MAKLRNLPHRALGTLYWAAQLEPDRSDYVRDYLFYYLQMDMEELFIEGSTRPVVPMYAVAQARKFPRNQEMQNIGKLFMARHFKKLKEEEEIEVVTEEREPNKEGTDIEPIPELEIKEGWIRE